MVQFCVERIVARSPAAVLRCVPVTDYGSGYTSVVDLVVAVYRNVRGGIYLTLSPPALLFCPVLLIFVILA